MTPELKTEWTTALRSGKYVQAHNQLHRGENRFCCLGVLSCILDIKDYDEYGYPYEFLADPIASKLIDMNDHEGKSFAEIADWIDANL